MEPLGEVIAILNDSVILIRAEHDFSPGTELTVYGEVKLEEQQKKEIGLERVIFPKGQIFILGKQEKENCFLASLVLTKHEKKTVYKKHTLSALSSIFGTLYGPSEEVWHEVPLTPKPQIDQEYNLSLVFNKVITVGDKICAGDYFKK